MAVWIPVTVVPTSLATVAIDTFITDVSSVMTNWPTASVRSTIPAALVLRSAVSALIWDRRYERRHVFESPSEGEPGDLRVAHDLGDGEGRKRHAGEPVSPDLGVGDREDALEHHDPEALTHGAQGY